MFIITSQTVIGSIDTNGVPVVGDRISGLHQSGVKMHQRALIFALYVPDKSLFVAELIFDSSCR